jgi:uracil-DNA glycosylase
MEVQIESSWKMLLAAEFSKPYFQQIALHIKTEKSAGKTVYPPGPLIFNAFNTLPFSNVKVVLLGQDPYHGVGQAMGLSFSVPKNINPPPSLKNIYKEMHDDIGAKIPVHGDLTKWAQQGVLLLNASLTVRAGEPNSHALIGWHQFTNQVIQKLSQEKKGLVFLLWGKFAQEKESLIDSTKHHILKAAHPSPYSALNGFFGCRHFSKTNQLLTKEGYDPVDWHLD